MKNNARTPTSATPSIDPQAMHRTFRFRADNANVAESLLWMLVSWAEKTWLEPHRPADISRVVQVTLTEGAPQLEELRWLFQQVANADLALATLNVAASFDGTKQEFTNNSLSTRQPSELKVERARHGLQMWAHRTLQHVGAAVLAADKMRPFSSPGATFAFLPTPLGSLTADLDPSTLAEQDTHYFRNRLPFATKPGAEHRTFRFRVEFEKDVAPLLALIKWAVEDGWQSKEGSGDCEVKFSLREDTLTLDEVRWLFKRIVDCHVAAQTLALAYEYTGERTYEDAETMGAKSPRGAALQQCVAGANDLRDYYRSCAEGLEEACDQMERELW